MKKRPRHLDVCLHENHVVYASHTLVGKEWVGGLFSKGGTNKGSVLCEYTGQALTKYVYINVLNVNDLLMQIVG